MADLRIRHRTVYRYRVPVFLGPHRLLLRPREGRDLRLLESKVCVTPDATVRWAYDVSGNAVATAVFNVSASNLIIDSVARVDLSAESYPIFDIAASAIAFPFAYSDDERIDLGALTALQYPEAERLQAWARGFIAADPTDTLSLLKDINFGVAHYVTYLTREDEGTQSPDRTLKIRQGSCRDLATLFAEAVRSLGFGARIVSGYLHDPTRTLLGSVDAGSTHAWAEVYLPGAGWITFDPTNRRVGGANLIPVAVARDIRQAMPMSGSYSGPADALREMTVEVTVD